MRRACRGQGDQRARWSAFAAYAFGSVAVGIAAAYDENGKADACTLAFYTPTSHKPPCLTIAINATAKRKTLKSILGSGAFTVGYPSIEQAAEAD